MQNEEKAKTKALADPFFSPSFNFDFCILHFDF